MRATAKYGAVGKITLLSSLVYSGDVILRAGLMLIVLFVFLQLWSVTYGNGGFESIAGFSLRDIVWYLVLTETVVMSAPRVSTKIDQEVKSGELAYVLLRPYSYVAYHLAAYWGEAVLRLPLVLGVGAAVALPSVGMPAISLPRFRRPRRPSC